MTFSQRIARAIMIGGMLDFACCASAMIVWGCGNEPSKNATAPATSGEEQQALQGAKDYFGFDAETPTYVYTPAVLCGNGVTCCDSTCRAAGVEGQSCWMFDNSIHISIAGHEICGSQHYKLQVESCNAVAWQNGIYVDQWDQPCGQL